MPRRPAWRLPGGGQHVRVAVIGAYLLTAIVVGGYLGRSMLIDDEVNERVVRVTPPAPDRAGGGAAERPRNVLLRRGRFESVAHPAEGTATSDPHGGRPKVLTLTNFEVDNGPDLRVLSGGGARARRVRGRRLRGSGRAEGQQGQPAVRAPAWARPGALFHGRDLVPGVLGELRAGATRMNPGERFPDLDLPDHTGRPRRLSELGGGDPVALFTSRGWWCPKEQRYMRGLCRLQDEFEVAYARIVVVSVDLPEVQSAFRAGLGARFTFLSDRNASGCRGWGCSRRPTPSTTPTCPRPSHSSPTSGSTGLQRLLVLRPSDPRRAPARHARDHDGGPRGLGGAGGVRPFAFVVFDGARLSLDPRAPGRRLRIDPRCVEGEPVTAPLRTSARWPTGVPRSATTSPRSSRRGETRSPGGSQCWATTSSA